MSVATPILHSGALLLAGALISLPGLAQGQVWTVDDDAPADFADLQPAIDAASAGDLLLVRAGDYGSFALVGKGLSVVADEGAEVFVRGPQGSVTSSVSAVPAGQRALLRGLLFEPALQLFGQTLRVESCAGTVWIEDVEVRVPIPLAFVYQLDQGENLLIEDCAEVVVVDSLVRGASGASQGAGLEGGSIGLTARNSQVHLYHCEVLGGTTAVLGGPGRPGTRVQGGTVVLRDSRSTGGTGGEGFIFGPGPGNGGAGLDLSASGVVWSIGSELLGGAGGTDFFSGATGNPGPPFVNFGGTMNQQAAAAVRLASPAVVRDDQFAEFSLEAPADSTAFLLVNLTATPVFVEALAEAVVVGLSPILVPLGAVDGGGQLTLTLALPPLPPSLPTWNATLQFAVITPGLALEFSDGTITTVVDDSF